MSPGHKLYRCVRAHQLENLEQRTMLASSSTFAVELLPVEATHAISYRMEDLSGDGLLDVAILSQSEITWFDRAHDARSFRHRQSFDVQASHFDFVDLDGDQRLDLVFAAAASGIQWYRNNGLGEFEAESRDLAAVADVGEFAAADVDNDGDSDLLIALHNGAILHLENADGFGTFRLKEQINGVATELPEMRVADLNNDIALDLLITSSAGVAWHKNVDGHLGIAGSRNKISSGAASSPQLADIDSDGDLDVVMRRATPNGGELVWLENHDAEFEQDHLIRTELSQEAPSTSFTGDVDHDGDVDIVSFHASRDSKNNTLIVYSNTDGRGTLRSRQLSGSAMTLIGVGDTNDDSHLDILATRSDGRLMTYDLRVIGDVDRDGSFGTSDLVMIFQSGHYEDDVKENSTFREGDWNGDREFTSRDLVFAFQAGTFEQFSYPRLFFTKKDLPKLKAKLENPTRKSQFDREIEIALNTIHIDYSNRNLYEATKGIHGQRYAFLALMLESDDPLRDTFAQKARDILANANEGRWPTFGKFPTRPATFDLSEALHPWHTGHVLMNLSLTYDWLIGAGELDGVARQDARFRILRLTQMEHTQQKIPYDEFDHANYPIRLANYALRSVAGVGFAALAFPDQKGFISDPYDRLEPEHRTEFDTSETLQWVLDELFQEITTSSKSNPANGQSLIEHYVTSDGMVREGFLYEIDTYEILIPLLVALDRLNGDDYLSSDGLTDGRLLEAFDTNFKVMLPNRYRPLTGDSFIGNHYLWHEVAAAYTDDPGAHYWAAGTVTTNLGISFAYYDDSISQEQPEYRTEFLADAGLAVFRDKWGSDATYLMLVAQDDPIMGHDQADQASISLFAHGTPLVIETGYGAAYNHDPEARLGGKHHWIKSALGHSTMTIDSVYTVDTTPPAYLWLDGVTPTVARSYTKVPDPATIENTLAARHVDYAEAHVTYTEKQSNLVRAVVFPRHRYFILEDTMTSDESHQYGWQLHLGKTETGGFTGTDDSYVWTTPNPHHSHIRVSLGIHMLDDEDRNVNVYDNGPTNRGGYGYPAHVYDHTYILADKEAEDAKFVTLLDPYQNESDKLAVETLIEGQVWKVVHSPTSYDLILSQTESTEIQFGEIRTDAKFVVASVDTVNGREEVISVLARGGTELQIGYDHQQTLQIPDDTLLHFEAPE